MRLIAFYLTKNSDLLFVKEVDTEEEALRIAINSIKASTLQLYKLIKPLLDDPIRSLEVQYSKNSSNGNWEQCYRNDSQYIMGCIK